MQKQIFLISLIFPVITSCIMTKTYTRTQTPYNQVVSEITGPFHRQRSTINGICEGIRYAYRYCYGSLGENKYVKINKGNHYKCIKDISEVVQRANASVSYSRGHIFELPFRHCTAKGIEDKMIRSISHYLYEQNNEKGFYQKELWDIVREYNNTFLIFYNDFLYKPKNTQYIELRNYFKSLKKRL